MRVLMTTFEGGGHVPPALRLARRLKTRGAEVLVMSDEANRAQVQRSGLAFAPWRRAPNRRSLTEARDPLRDWRARWPPAVVRAVLDGVIAGPAADYAEDVVEEIRRFRPDLVLSNELLFGAMAAAEAERVPLALVTAGTWCFPTRLEAPPFGPAFPPARTPFEHRRERAARRMIAGWYDQGLPSLNRARARLGLPRLARLLDQLDAAGLVLIGTSRSFDYGLEAQAPFRYAGSLHATPSWARDGDGDDLLSADRPNVLVSFSTTPQGQERTAARVLRALEPLEVHVILTLGPALDPDRLPRPANARLTRRADHDLLAPRCRLMICHGGHGTAIRPLLHGVPVICIPTGRDQPENAARIAWSGAGLRLPRRASVPAIRRAARRVLGDPAFAASARRLGEAVARDSDGGRGAAEALETFVRTRRAARGGPEILPARRA